MDRKAFFDSLRASLFRSGIKQSQVDALDAIIDECTARGLPLDSVAYVMATAYWEPGADMVPREESLWYTTAARIRAVWPSRFPTVASAAPYVKNPKALAMKVYGNRSELGNLTAEDGWDFRGRGLVQITGRANYQRAEMQTGLPIMRDPDILLDLKTAVVVLVEGMQEGWFTGVTLADGAAVPGFEDDRRIVNGTNEAKRIAAFAEAFQGALSAAGYTGEPAKSPALSEQDIAALRALTDWLMDAPADPVTIGQWLAAMPQEARQ